MTGRAWASSGHEQAQRPWIPYHENLTAGLAALTGATTGEVVAMNSLTVNLHLMLASFYRPQGPRRRILIEAGAFSSDRHAVTSQLGWHGLDPAEALLELAPVAGEDTVSERDARGVPGAARRARSRWCCGRACSSAPARRSTSRASRRRPTGTAASPASTWPIRSATCRLPCTPADADFAVWCSYKYLNARARRDRRLLRAPAPYRGAAAHCAHRRSRGAPGRLVGPRAQSRFLMEPQFRAAAGAAAWQLSNPSMLAAAPLLASLGVFVEAGIDRLRAQVAWR